MTKDCAELYREYMEETTFYPHEAILDTAIDFRAWLKKNKMR